ncbi:MAG: OmpH family outer membrane protein [Tepidisphaeraceae bacterium]
MRSLKTLVGLGIAGMIMAATPGSAQGAGQQPPTQPPVTAQPPATPKPPATTPPATAQPPAKPAAPAAAPAAPRPFPEGAKMAYIDIQAIASLSAEGRAATARIQDWEKKKNSELTEKNKTLQAAQTKLQQGSGVLSDAARVQLEKDIEKMQRDLQFAQQDAQTERTDLTNQLQGEFQEKLNPVIEQLRTEKGLLMIFSIRDSGVVSVDTGLDLSGEVVKRFDAVAKTAPKK